MGLNLQHLFGPLEDGGVDEQCAMHAYKADSGLALVQVSPSGHVVVSDPKKAVTGITIRFSATGEFSPEDLQKVDDFLARVMFSRNAGRGQVTKFSLTAPPSATTNGSTPAATVAASD